MVHHYTTFWLFISSILTYFSHCVAVIKDGWEINGGAYLDRPALLTADQLEVLPQVGAVAEEADFDNLHREDAFPAQVHGGRHIRGICRAGGRHAPPGQGVDVA